MTQCKICFSRRRRNLVKRVKKITDTGDGVTLCLQCLLFPEQGRRAYPTRYNAPNATFIKIAVNAARAELDDAYVSPFHDAVDDIPVIDDLGYQELRQAVSIRMQGCNHSLLNDL